MGTVEVEAQPLTTSGDAAGPTIFFSLLSTSDVDIDEFESALRHDHTVDDWQTVLEFTDCITYKIHLSREAKLTAPEIATLGVHILSIRSATAGWRLKLQAPDKDRLGAYWEYCRDEDVEFTLEKLYSTGPQSKGVDGHRLDANLTDRQREVATTAARMGYYEPDGASAETVAAELDISPLTLSTHLRRIAAKLFDALFGE